MLEPQRIRGVIFDLDGVLIRSAACHAAAFEQVFETWGIQDFDYTLYAGWRTPEVVEDVLKRRGISAAATAISEASREKSRIARQLLAESSPVDPDCTAILAELAARYPLALASSGSRASVDAFLKMTGAHGLFASVLSGDDVTHAKPHPEIYLRSAERLGLNPAECLVVEDAVAGLEAARAAGSPAAAIEGTVPRNLLLLAGAGSVMESLRELPALRDPPPPVNASCWTAIIPAAGRGSRLGFHRPKILFPVAGRMILEWLLDFLEPNCSRLVFVLSPEGVSEVAAELNRHIPGRFDIVIQELPTGMGDAVELGLCSVRTPHAAVIWGDQVALRRRSVEACLRLHQGPLQPEVTCPMVLRSRPYIHFDRDSKGRLSGLLQAREGDALPEWGESDTGFFCFRAASLGRLLTELRASPGASGARTREFNLLPAIPLAAREGAVVTPRVMSLEETIGINSAQDVSAVEEFLRGSCANRLGNSSGAALGKFGEVKVDGR